MTTFHYSSTVPLPSILLILSSPSLLPTCSFFFFFNDPAPTEIYPLPLPDALPIYAPPATRRSTLARSFLLPRHYLRGPGGRLSQLGSEGGPMVLRRKDAGRADRSGSAGGPAAFERTRGTAADFPVPAPASFTPRPAERPGLHFSDPLEGRCGQKGCIFPARPGGSRLCAVHELEQREPKCFHSRQPSSLLLEQAKKVDGNGNIWARAARARGPRK